MTDLAKLVVRLEAETARYQAELDKARKQLGSFEVSALVTVKRISQTAAALAAAAPTAILAMTTAVAASAREINNQARVANAGVEEFQRYAYGARTVGIEQEKLADILKDVNDRVGDFMSTGAGPMADFFEKVAPRVGVTADAFRELSGPQALQLFYDSLQKANLSQAEMTFYLEAMASDTTALIPLLRNGGMEFRRLGGEAERAGAILRQQDFESVLDISDSMRSFAAEIRGFGISVVRPVLPVLRDVTDAMSDLRDEMGGVGGQLDNLAAKDEIRVWAERTAIGLAMLAESGIVVARTMWAVAGSGRAVLADMELIGEFIGRGGVLGLALEENRRALSNALEDRNRVVDTANQRYVELWNYNATALSDALRKQFSNVEESKQLFQDMIDVATGLSDFRVVQEATQIPFRPGFGAQSGAPVPRALISPEAQKEVDAARKALQGMNDDLRRQAETFGMTEAAAMRWRAQHGDIAQLLRTAGEDMRPLVEQTLAFADALGTAAERQKIDDMIDALRQQIAVQDLGPVSAMAWRIANGDLKDSIAALGEQAGPTTEQLLELTAQADESARTGARLSEMMQQAAQVFESTRTPLELFNAELERLNALRQTMDQNGSPLIDEETYNRGVEMAQQTLNNAKKTTDAMSAFADQAARNAQSVFADFLFDPFEAGLEGMVSSFAKAMQRMLAEAIAAHVIEQVLSAAGIGSGEGGGGWFGGARASGGPIDPGKLYLVGEEGPELVMPRAGMQVYSHDDTEQILGGRGGRSVTQVFNITTPDADSFRASQRQIARRARLGMMTT